MARGAAIAAFTGVDSRASAAAVEARASEAKISERLSESPLVCAKNGRNVVPTLARPM